ncbi:MAG: histidine phosphatase family protein [Natronincolaceae bacterium]|jgi:broad specificity phosphatase PhoE|nr:histidine phosphatase family protein [Bacillota bacterium]NLK90824.1 histidine phosphatase family protein [Clostridiales bacterium]
MKKLYLVRHGQTLWNLEGKTQGSKNSGLTPLGFEQAKKLGEYFRDIELGEIYCSTLQRAYSTAQIIADIKNLDCKLDSRLVEMNFGEWEGLTRPEIKKRYPDDFRTWMEKPHLANIPSGETIEIAQKRMVDFVDDKIIKSDKDTILVVSHGTVIRLLLLSVLSMDLKHYYKLKLSNGSVNLVEFRYYGPVLIKYNDTCHMDIII